MQAGLTRLEVRFIFKKMIIGEHLFMIRRIIQVCLDQRRITKKPGARRKLHTQCNANKCCKREREGVQRRELMLRITRELTRPHKRLIVNRERERKRGRPH